MPSKNKNSVLIRSFFDPLWSLLGRLDLVYKLKSSLNLWIDSAHIGSRACIPLKFKSTKRRTNDDDAFSKTFFKSLSFKWRFYDSRLDKKTQITMNDLQIWPDTHGHRSSIEPDMTIQIHLSSSSMTNAGKILQLVSLS